MKNHVSILTTMLFATTSLIFSMEEAASFDLKRATEIAEWSEAKDKKLKMYIAARLEYERKTSTKLIYTKSVSVYFSANEYSIRYIGNPQIFYHTFSSPILDFDKKPTEPKSSPDTICATADSPAPEPTNFIASFAAVGFKPTNP